MHQNTDRNQFYAPESEAYWVFLETNGFCCVWLFGAIKWRSHSTQNGHAFVGCVLVLNAPERWLGLILRTWKFVGAINWRSHPTSSHNDNAFVGCVLVLNALKLKNWFWWFKITSCQIIAVRIFLGEHTFLPWWHINAETFCHHLSPSNGLTSPSQRSWHTTLFQLMRTVFFLITSTTCGRYMKRIVIIPRESVY